MDIEINKVKIIVTMPVENVNEVRNAVCEVGATLTIPIHMDNPAFPPDYKFIEEK